MTRIVTFDVSGIPAPQGSKRYLGTSGGKGILVESSKRVAPWRADVRAAAIQVQPFPPLDGALDVELTFRLPRPMGHYGTGGNAGAVRRSAPTYPYRKPDIDKLARAVLDALRGVIWLDDAQVVRLHATKDYTESDYAGLTATIETMKEKA